MGPDTATPADSHEIVIQGLTEAGTTFRPSDWAERLCGMMSIFGEDKQLSYSPYLKPIMAAGVRCVVVDRRLETIDLAAFTFLLAFAKGNELRLRPGRKPVSQQDAPPEAERRAPPES